MSPRLVRTVLAVYPRAIRDRYGAEVAELLAQSHRPARDLADVAWCAFADRMTHKPEAFMTLVPVRPIPLIKLLGAPAVFLVALWAVAAATLGVFSILGPAGSPLTRAIGAVLAAVVGVLAFWWGRRMGRAGSITAPGMLAPVALAVGGTVAWMSPSIAMPDASFGESLLTAVATVGCWCAGMVALNIVTDRLRGRVSALALGAITVVGGLAVLELSTVVNVLTYLDAQSAPSRYALLWYPTAVTGLGSAQVDPYLVLQEMVRGSAMWLTVCTVFVLSLVAAARTTRPEPAPAPAVASV